MTGVPYIYRFDKFYASNDGNCPITGYEIINLVIDVELSNGKSTQLLGEEAQLSAA